MKEIWKAAPGYEGQYEVSDQGRVRTFRRGADGRLLKPGRMPGGHLSVAFGHGNSQCVHKLVLLAFVGPAPDKHECCHNNGDPADNRLENLRWGTRGDNSRDKVRLEEQYKLTVEDVKAIKLALKTPYWGINNDLGKKYNVSHVTISAIRHGRQHGWVSVD